MEALEPRVVDAAVEVLLAEVDRLVEVGEELGDGLDPLPRDAGGGVQRLGLLEVAGLDGRRERADRGHEVGHLGVDVGRVLVAGGRQVRLGDDRVGWQGRGGTAGHGERAARCREAAADHLVGPAIDPGGHVHDEARDDVLDLVDDAGAALHDLEFAGVAAGVGDDEGDRTRRDRDRGGGAAGSR